MTADRARGRAIAKVRTMLAARDGQLEADGTYRVPCYLCGATIDMAESANSPHGPTIEHLIPISRGGTSDLDNLRLTHRACNLSRGNKPPRTVGTQSRKWL